MGKHAKSRRILNINLRIFKNLAITSSFAYALKLIFSTKNKKITLL